MTAQLSQKKLGVKCKSIESKPSHFTTITVKRSAYFRLAEIRRKPAYRNCRGFSGVIVKLIEKAEASA